MHQLYRNRWSLVVLVLLLVTQACNAVSTTTPQAPVATEPLSIATTEAPVQTQAPVEATPAPIKTEIPDPEDICPTPGEGTAPT
jgi:hypothetical protein